MGKYLNLVGQTFGRLQVLSIEIVTGKRGGRYYNCLCNCGNTKVIHTRELRNGDTTSCGCYQKERAANTQYKHGLTNHPIYKSYLGMKERCLSINNSSYKDYGARGISICDEWLNSFEQFAKDMLPSWKEGLSIERIDTNKNYFLDNCMWANVKQQANNRRTSIRILFDNIEYTKEEFCKKFNISLRTVNYRIYNGKLSTCLLYKD